MATSTAPTERGGVDLATVFRSLNDHSRRQILEALRKRNPRQGAEFSTAEFLPNGEDRDSVEVQLRHTHLPLLDDAGFIDWNAEMGTITRGPKFEEIEPMLGLMADHQDELPEGWP